MSAIPRAIIQGLRAAGPRVAGALAKEMPSAAKINMYLHPELTAAIKGGAKVVKRDVLGGGRLRIEFDKAIPGGKKFLEINPFMRAADDVVTAKAQGALRKAVRGGKSPKEALEGAKVNMREPTVRLAARKYGEAWEAKPITTGAFTAAGALGLGAAVAGPGMNMVDAINGDPLGRAIEAEMTLGRGSMAAMLRAERLQEMKALNAARLAAARPHLYNQIVAGRPLPTGGIAIGGELNESLLDVVTGMMSRGEFAPPPSLEQQVMEQGLGTGIIP